ncbi:MAG: hypothetical protein ACFCU1_14090, partial [Sumerlaeia bacterium]
LKGETARVYNFSVDGLETYFVGEDGVLVHNCHGNSKLSMVIILLIQQTIMQL